MKDSKKGYIICYIDFVSKEAADKCLSIDRTVLDGNTIFVAISKPPEKFDDGSQTLFLNNLPFGLTTDDIKHTFHKYLNDIVDIRLKNSYAFIKFKNTAMRNVCYKKMQPLYMKNRKIIVKKSTTNSIDNGSKNVAQEEGKIGKRQLDSNNDHIDGDESKKDHEESKKIIESIPEEIAEANLPKDQSINDTNKEKERTGDSNNIEKKKGKSNKDFRKLLGL